MQKYGLQLYSVRDAMASDFDGTLKRVAELGYTYVEFAGFFDHSAEEVKALLDKYGLTVVGTHTGIQALKEEDLEETIRYHKAIGAPRLIVPSAKVDTVGAMDELVNTLNFAAPRLAEEGIKLGFHNHAVEFETAPWGKTPISELESRTQCELEIDTFWAWKAGSDPVNTIEALKDRISLIHLKDGFADGKGMPLGEGDAPVAAVRKKALELGYVIVVESETLTPSGLDEAERCIRYLRGLDAADCAAVNY